MASSRDVLSAGEGFPAAPIYTLIHNREAISQRINGHAIRTSWLQKVPGILQHAVHAGDAVEAGDVLARLENIGLVRELKQVEGDQQGVISTLRKGRSFGEMAIIDKLTRSATVRAKTAVAGQLFPKNEFERWLTDGHPCAAKLAFNIGRVLARRLEETNLALVKLVKPEEVREFEAFRDKLVTEWNF